MPTGIAKPRVPVSNHCSCYSGTHQLRVSLMSSYTSHTCRNKGHIQPIVPSTEGMKHYGETQARSRQTNLVCPAKKLSYSLQNACVTAWWAQRDRVICFFWAVLCPKLYSQQYKSHRKACQARLHHHRKEEMRILWGLRTLD